MEPFVAEKEQRITNEAPIQSNGKNQRRNNSLIIVLLALVLLCMGGALLAIVFTQQQSFNALQQNFQTLQNQLGTQPLPVIPEKTENNLAPGMPQDDPVDDRESESISMLTATLSQLDKKTNLLETQISQLDTKITKLPAPSTTNNKALTQTTNKLANEVATLRKEILEMKLTMNDMETTSKTWRADINRRLNSSEASINSLSKITRKLSTGGNSDYSAELQRISREIKSLKKQHPYMND